MRKVQPMGQTTAEKIVSNRRIFNNGICLYWPNIDYEKVNPSFSATIGIQHYSHIQDQKCFSIPYFWYTLPYLRIVIIFFDILLFTTSF